MTLETGIKGSASCTVTLEDTAKALGSGGLDVFSTPKLVALMENAALTLVKPYLDEGSDTVGTKLEVAHLAATPVGMTVRAEADSLIRNRTYAISSPISVYVDEYGNPTFTRQPTQKQSLRSMVSLTESVLGMRTGTSGTPAWALSKITGSNTLGSLFNKGVAETDPDQDVARTQAMGALLRQWFGDRVLGPDKPPVAKVKAMNIRKMVVKLENGIDLAKARLYLDKGKNTVLQDKRYKTVQIYFDVDPL